MFTKSNELEMRGVILFFAWGIIYASSAQDQSSSLFRKEPDGKPFSFIEYQRTFSRPNEAMRRKLDTLQKQFLQKKLTWPAKYIYIRSFKYDSQLEVWVKNNIREPFKHFKTYKVCALAGTLGPKRLQGDFQVPEGFYYINIFNPKSDYYLSLGINYPNASDRILSDSISPGGDIYIHGSCVSVGCIPIRDDQIEELYILAAYAKDQGQDFIPVHIFPIRYDNDISVKYLEKLTNSDPELKKFSESLKGAYYYFEKHKQLPVVLFGPKGEYFVYDDVVSTQKTEEKKNKEMSRRVRTIDHISTQVHSSPQFPGGASAYAKYLNDLEKDMSALLPPGVKKAFIKVEFIIDKDGMPVNFKIVQGLNIGGEDFHNELISRMENMGIWKPAYYNDKPVPQKMTQTLNIG
ncbi:MAG: L,D-transpeptidase family protein [Chitinophagaceae bacterium]|nr:L,D-transpeptidase family protein [Chitinophagaceae bacterium]